jgi:hypothetical protein
VSQPANRFSQVALHKHWRGYTTEKDSRNAQGQLPEGRR